MKDLNYYLKLRYDTKLIGCSGLWAAGIPALQGCVAEGKTPDEAMAKLEEVKKLWLEDCLNSGRPVPEP
jgi:predicted RNase H-like HicB family nuclease